MDVLVSSFLYAANYPKVIAIKAKLAVDDSHSEQAMV